jgi:hypothetical protein
MVGDDFSMVVMPGMFYEYSSDWEDAGPIIERERIGFGWIGDDNGAKWAARVYGGYSYEGSTPLVAAMRAYVASKFGAEVPDIKCKK